MSDDPERDQDEKPGDHLDEAPEVTPAYSTPPASEDDDADDDA